MKMNKKMREAALTAMITLALSSSALAMPSGGTVTQGSVSINGTAAGSTIDSVASGATIVTNAHSIIDWKAFGIEAGQKLSFDTSNGALLNRVIGNDISKILGSLVQKGECPLLLVNPNGILVGGNATIDASQLVLSTLAISTDDFNHMNNGAGGLATFAKAANAGLGHIQVEKGAKINIDDVLLMAGGTVNVADGVAFTTTGKTTDGKGDAIVEIAAADKMVVDTSKSKQDAIIETESNKNNAVSFHGTFDNSQSQGNTNFHIDGGTVNLDNAKVKLNDNSEAYIVAGNKATNSATTDNVLSGKNMSVEGGKEVVIAGGNVTLEDANVSVNGKVSVAAGRTFDREKDEKGNLNNIVATEATTGNAVVLKNTTVQNTSKEIQVSGGKITLDNANVESNDTAAVNAYKNRAALNAHKINQAFENGNTVTAKNKSQVKAKNTVVVTGYGVEKSATSSFASNNSLVIADRNYAGDNITPVVAADGETTGYAVAPEAAKLTEQPTGEPTGKPTGEPTGQPTLSADDEANKQAGAQAVEKILSNSSKVADRQTAINNYVVNLNKHRVDDRKKAACVYGMLKELEGMKNAEGSILMLTVLNAYEPAKDAKEQAEQSKTVEGKNVAAQTVDVQTVQSTTGANESANDVAVDTRAVVE